MLLCVVIVSFIIHVILSGEDGDSFSYAAESN